MLRSSVILSRDSGSGAQNKVGDASSSGVSSSGSFKEPAGCDEAQESCAGVVPPVKDTTGLGTVDVIASTSQFCQRQPAGNAVDANSAVPVASEEKGEVLYSRKIFVGGLPMDIEAEQIAASFRPHGALHVSWPHMGESARRCPPSGFCFVLYKDEVSVHQLINACLLGGFGYYTFVSSPTVINKAVQVRPWVLRDKEIVIDEENLDPRKTVFIGGVPRPLTASKLAAFMARLFGDVAYAAINTDPDLGYPKGSGRVTFKHRSSMISALTARFVQIEIDDVKKLAQIKAFVHQDQICDGQSMGNQCGNQLALYYCGNVACLMYLCNDCWVKVHCVPERKCHKPLFQKCNFRSAEGAKVLTRVRY